MCAAKKKKNYDSLYEQYYTNGIIVLKNNKFGFLLNFLFNN